MAEIQNSSGIDFDELRITNFLHTKGTYTGEWVVFQV